MRGELNKKEKRELMDIDNRLKITMGRGAGRGGRGHREDKW